MDLVTSPILQKAIDDAKAKAAAAQADKVVTPRVATVDMSKLLTTSPDSKTVEQVIKEAPRPVKPLVEIKPAEEVMPVGEYQGPTNAYGKEGMLDASLRAIDTMNKSVLGTAPEGVPGVNSPEGQKLVAAKLINDVNKVAPGAIAANPTPPYNPEKAPPAMMPLDGSKERNTGTSRTGTKAEAFDWAGLGKGALGVLQAVLAGDIAGRQGRNLDWNKETMVGRETTERTQAEQEQAAKDWQKNLLALQNEYELGRQGSQQGFEESQQAKRIAAAAALARSGNTSGPYTQTDTRTFATPLAPAVNTTPAAASTTIPAVAQTSTSNSAKPKDFAGALAEWGRREVPGAVHDANVKWYNEQYLKDF